MPTKRALLLAASAITVAAAPAGAQPDPVAAEDDEAALGEIVVTAQRRAERLQDVSLAVTAFDGAALQNRQIDNIVDIMTTVPNLHASNNIGQGTATTAFIRGVGETESIISIDTPVGFYLDDVYIGRQGVNNMALFDVERIEVLRGPQGTLYGRNTSAGAIKVVTQRPKFETEGTVEASYGRFDAWNIKGSVNALLGGRVAIRANALVAGGGGDTRNVVLDERVNDHKFAGFRLAARFQPSDDVDVSIAGDWSRDNQQGRYGIDVSGILRPPTGSLYVASSGTDSRNVGKAYGLTGTIDWNASDNVALKSITAYRVTTQRYNLDLTDQPVPLYVLFTDAESKQFSHEFQVTGEAADGRLNYVGGLYFFDEASEAYIGDFIFQFLYFNKDLEVDVRSYAAFAQIDYAFSDRFSVILGGRFTRDEKRIDIVQRFGGTPGFAPVGAVIFDTATVDGQIIPARPGQPVKTELDFNRFTPKLGVEFKPNERLLLYATYTRGFKSGGWSARVTAPGEFFDFDPETIDAYEAGVKGTLLDPRATINVTGFYYDYKNLFNTGTTADGSFGIATSDAEIYGIEVETNWQLTEGVRLFANGAWQDGDRKAVTATTLALGNRFQRFPEWSFAAGVNGEWPLAARLKLRFNADYSYMDEHFVNPQNTAPARTGPVDLVNASLGIATSDDRYALLVGCRNCFGEAYINQILDFAALGFTTVYPGERSTWSVTARARF
jgi:iron complex outermembrane receptor protein